MISQAAEADRLHVADGGAPHNINCFCHLARNACCFRPAPAEVTDLACKAAWEGLVTTQSSSSSSLSIVVVAAPALDLRRLAGDGEAVDESSEITTGAGLTARIGSGSHTQQHVGSALLLN